jgi:DNA-dependent protein kinase catalytic subunit
LSAASNYFKLLLEGLNNFVTGNSDIGSYNLEYFVNFKKILHSKKIDKNTVINLDTINSLIEQLQAIKVLHQSGGVKISHFSLWLSSFDPTTHKIELPGANLKEDVDPHSQDVDYIFSIDQNLLVMDSIRKPKRIVIYGISGQEYKYLVKSGEDLRCDQRIQQLFNSMNKILISATNNLQIRTYKVIPMTTSLGILEWIANTIPMNKMICESMLNDETFRLQNPKAFKENKQSQSKEFNVKLLAASEERLNWINYKEDAKIYHDNFIHKSHKDAVLKWESITSKMPDDFLRKKIVKSSHSPEAFYSFRTEFSKSLSISSIYCFICGIGDRHLDNILIDIKSGSVIHIDFDMCFGKATFILPVPEFIPFRITPQMLAVVQPLDGGILFRRYMISTLTALRSTSSIKYLSNELEIYLTDPVTDWLKSEKERGRIQELIEDEKWEPKRRIMSTVR